jgi:FixJ family two-component response regulator
MPSPIVFVVDDDADVRTALSRLLHSAGLDPVTFDSPQAFLGRYDSAEPACLVLDLAMPGVDGLELQGILATQAPSLQIVFLTGHGDIATGVQAMKRGAVDFLTKPVDDETLLAAIAQALARARAAHDAQAKWRSHRERLGLLTAREREVLDGIVAGKLNKQIAFELGTVEKTIKFHRANLVRKLGLRTVADLVRFAERVGAGKPGRR